jgi:hypothetical protein
MSPNDSENFVNSPISNEIIIGKNPDISPGGASQNLDKISVSADVGLIALIAEDRIAAHETLHNGLGSVICGVIAYHDLDTFFSECLGYNKVEALL